MATTLRNVMRTEVRNRDDYYFFKMEYNLYRSQYPNGPDTVITDDAANELRERKKDRKQIKKFTKYQRKISSKLDKLTGKGRTINDPKAKTEQEIKDEEKKDKEKKDKEDKEK